MTRIRNLLFALSFAVFAFGAVACSGSSDCPSRPGFQFCQKCGTVCEYCPNGTTCSPCGEPCRTK
jgi:hypothetical protein